MPATRASPLVFFLGALLAAEALLAGPQAGRRARVARPASATEDSFVSGDNFWSDEDVLDSLRRRADELELNELERAMESRNAELLKRWTYSWLILFGSELDYDDECAVHTLSTPGRETVLAFESQSDASDFARRLEETSTIDATPRAEHIELASISDWLASDDRIRLVAVPEGTRLTPPSAVVPMLEYDPTHQQSHADGTATATRPKNHQRPNEKVPDAEVDRHRKYLETIFAL